MVTVTVSATSPTAITATTAAGQTAVAVSASGTITIPTANSLLMLVSSTSGTNLPVFTLPAGAFDGQTCEFKRLAAGAFTIAATMDGVSSASLTTGSGVPATFAPLDDVMLRWCAGPATWIVR